MLPLISPTDRAFITSSSTCRTPTEVDKRPPKILSPNWAVLIQVYQNDLCTCPSDLINGDFGALSDLGEGELSVVRWTSESHLEGDI